MPEIYTPDAPEKAPVEQTEGVDVDSVQGQAPAAEGQIAVKERSRAAPLRRRRSW